MPGRTRITPNKGASRFIRRDARGRFTKSQDDVGRSLATDRQQSAKSGQGDRGDQAKR